MKIQYTVNEHTTFEVEVPNDMKAAFRFLASANEIFGIRECGNCGSKNLKFQFRQAKNKEGKICDYYSIKCLDCGHEFKFGIRQAEGQPLFPKTWEPPYQKPAQQQDDYSQDSTQDEPTYAGAGSGNGNKVGW